MKTCHVCGTQVDDRELVCPECGATVVKSTGSFALKNEAPVKKKSNPMGTTVSTGSGLTDILKADDDGYDMDSEVDFTGGSMPVTLSKTDIEDDGYKPKKKSRVGGIIFKIILFLAIAYGIYYLVVNVFMKKEGATEYKQVVDIYMEAVNDADADKLVLIVPPYITGNLDTAEMMLDKLKGTTVDKYSIVSVTNYDSKEIIALQDSIKVQTAKTANISEACVVKVKTSGTILDFSGQQSPKNSEFDMVLIKIRDRWYLHIDTYGNPFED